MHIHISHGATIEIHPNHPNQIGFFDWLEAVIQSLGANQWMLTILCGGKDVD